MGQSKTKYVGVVTDFDNTPKGKLSFCFNSTEQQLEKKK